MFDNKKFILESLLSGYDNKSFTESQVVIYSMNYFNRGLFTQNDLDKVQLHLYPPIQDDEE